LAFFPIVWGSFFKELFPLFGGYTDARFLLAFALLTAPILFILKVPGVRVLPLTGWLLFCGSGVVSLLADPFVTSSSWVEAIYYPAFLVSVAGIAYVLKECRYPAFFVPVYGLVGGMMLYAFKTPAEYLFAISDDVSRIDKFLPWGFVNIRYWSHLTSWLLPLLPLAVLAGPWRDNRLWRFGVAVTAGIWWWLIILSTARGSFVSILVGGTIVLLLFGKHAKPWLSVLFRQIGIGVAFWVLLSVLIPWMFLADIELRGVGMDGSGRMRLWSEAWAMSLVNFPFGMGPQSWLTHEVITPAYETGKRLGHPHNMYLMWAAEYGWLAVFGLILIGVEGVRRVWNVRREIALFSLQFEQTQLMIALVASVIAAFFHAGASAVFLAPASMLVGLVVLAVFWAVISHSQFGSGFSGPRDFGRLTWGRALVALMAFMSLLFWNLEVVRYYKAMRLDQSWYAENVRQPFYPRFWYHGYYPRHPDLMPTRNE
jgi:hypothetical protein